MFIYLLNNVKVDIDNIPENFDEIIRKSFENYTELTNPDYTYQDKLKYIDDTTKILHKAAIGYEAIKNLMLENFEYELDEYGNIPEREDYLSVEFMEHCFTKGQDSQKMYSHDYTKDNHDNEKIMKILCRIIKVVMNYEK